MKVALGIVVATFVCGCGDGSSSASVAAPAPSTAASYEAVESSPDDPEVEKLSGLVEACKSAASNLEDAASKFSDGGTDSKEIVPEFRAASDELEAAVAELDDFADSHTGIRSCVDPLKTASSDSQDAAGDFDTGLEEWSEVVTKVRDANDDVQSALPELDGCEDKLHDDDPEPVDRD